MKNVFRQLCEEKGLTVFVSTHTMDVLQEVCDRIAIIHKAANRSARHPVR